MFNAKQHLKKLNGNVDYLPPARAIQWFKTEHPNGRIVTHMLSVDPPIFRAEVYIGDDLVATAHADPDGNTKTFRKVETAAIRRALANAGYDATGALLQEGDTPEPESPFVGNQPIAANCTTVDIREKNGKTYLVLTCATSGHSYKVSEHSRRKFIEAGWIGDQDWLKPATIALNPFVPVTIAQAANRFWNLVDVAQKPNPFNKSKAESVS